MDEEATGTDDDEIGRGGGDAASARPRLAVEEHSEEFGCSKNTVRRYVEADGRMAYSRPAGGKLTVVVATPPTIGAALRFIASAPSALNASISPLVNLG